MCFFEDADSASTTATFSLAGTYVLRVIVSDGSFSASDDVLVTVEGTNPIAGVIGEAGSVKVAQKSRNSWKKVNLINTVLPDR